jgi:two-component system, CitB family, sensor kinase
LTRTVPPRGELTVIDDNTVHATRLPVLRDGHDLGQVLVLRDHSDLDNIGRELEATRALTDALRAQAHEYTNRIHTVSGMLHLGHVDDAQTYLVELEASTTWGELITDPYLAGLLTAKSAAASEAGVTLRVGETTWVDGRLTHPLDCVTVVANLVDNGIRAAAAADATHGWVEITLASDGEALVVHVCDSGPGLAEATAADIFQPGFTTRHLDDNDRGTHGLGLALAQRTARRHHGDVVLVDPGGQDHGAVFSARLEGVLHTSTMPSAP